MAITNFTADVENISKLLNDPIDGVDIKDADDLKARFDKAGADIKAWITDVLTPYVNGLSSGSNLANNAVDTANIKDGAVTASKLQASAPSKWHLQDAIYHETVTIAPEEWLVTSYTRTVDGNIVSTAVYAATKTVAYSGLVAPYVESGEAIVVPTHDVQNTAKVNGAVFDGGVSVSSSGTWGTVGFSETISIGVSTVKQFKETISLEIYVIP